LNVIITNIVAVFLIMGVGFVANRIGLLPEKANDYLSPLLIKITTPCLVLATISSKEIEEGMAGVVLMDMACCAMYFVVFCFLGWLLCAKIMKIPSERDTGVYIMLFASINNGFIGLPITYAIFGEEKLFYMVFFQMILMVYIYGPGTFQMHYGEKGGGHGLSALKSVLGPGTIAAILGIILLFMGTHLPEVLFKAIESIGSATTPISMILIGVQLGSSNFKKIVKNKELMIESTLKMIFTPVITFLLVNWLPIPNALKLVLIFGSSFPSAVATAPIAATEGKDSRLAAEGVALTTLMSLVTIPLTAYVVSLLYL